MGVAMPIPLEPTRMVFEQERADNPRLYDDLIRFTEGPKRVNRLRTLAQEGSLAQQLPMGFRGRITVPRAKRYRTEQVMLRRSVRYSSNP